jgi:hypothetical protein
LQVDERFLEGLLDNVFGIFPSACLAERNQKNLSLMTLEQIFKRLFVPVLRGNHKHLFRCEVARACPHWFCCVVHIGLHPRIAPCVATGDNARPTPNLRDGKCLNFQRKTDRQLKLSKLRTLKELKMSKVSKRLEGASAHGHLREGRGPSVSKHAS